MENIPVDVYVDADELSRAVAVQFASTINAATAAGIVDQDAEKPRCLTY